MSFVARDANRNLETIIRLFGEGLSLSHTVIELTCDFRDITNTTCSRGSFGSRRGGEEAFKGSDSLELVPIWFADQRLCHEPQHLA